MISRLLDTNTHFSVSQQVFPEIILHGGRKWLPKEDATWVQEIYTTFADYMLHKAVMEIHSSTRHSSIPKTCANAGLKTRPREWGAGGSREQPSPEWLARDSQERLGPCHVWMPGVGGGLYAGGKTGLDRWWTWSGMHGVPILASSLLNQSQWHLNHNI
jgi:hypothetical protein